MLPPSGVMSRELESSFSNYQNENRELRLRAFVCSSKRLKTRRLRGLTEEARK